MHGYASGVPETLNYLAANAMTGNDDCCHKNYYVYRDSEAETTVGREVAR